MAVTLNLDPRPVPLVRLENGVYRVKESRLPLERIVEGYKAGATPEEIVDSFDILRLSDVYTLIGYYLEHKQEVEAYLREQEEDAEEIRRMIEKAMPPRAGFREELLRRKALRERNQRPNFPPPLDGPGLIQFATVTRATRASGKTQHSVKGELAGPAMGLAIYHCDDGNGYFLFGCDSDWEVLTDTWHATLEEAINQAEFEYPGISGFWQRPE